MKTENLSSRNELALFHISKLSPAVMPMLATVTVADNSVDCWIEFINDSGETVRLLPDSTGWQDGRREVMAMNASTGRNRKLFFTADGRANNMTLQDPELVEILWSIPHPVLNWAVSHAKGR